VLVLTRRTAQRIVIGDDVVVTVLEMKGDTVRLGIDAPRSVTVHREEDTEVSLTASSDGRPFWLVLGQSNSDGWSVTVTGGRAGARQLVDGYANGWLITPDEAGDLAIRLQWEPQRLVWLGFVGTALTLVACALILWRSRGRALEASLLDPPGLAVSRAPGLRDLALLVRVGAVAGLGLLVAPPEMAIAAAVVVGLVPLLPLGGPVLATVATAALLVSRAAHRPSLAWVSVLVLLGVVLRDQRDDVVTG